MHRIAFGCVRRIVLHRFGRLIRCRRGNVLVDHADVTSVAASGIASAVAASASAYVSLATTQGTLFGRPGVFAFGASVFLGLQYLDFANLGSVVDTVGATLAVTGMASMLFLLPRENDLWDADCLAFDFEAFLFDVNHFGFQRAARRLACAFGATNFVLGFFEAPAGLHLMDLIRGACKRYDR